MQSLDDTQRIRFPNPENTDRWGVVAQGGNLSPGVVLSAYEQGIFPWYDEPPILWHSPDPRFVLYLEDFHLPRRFHRTLRNAPLTVTIDLDFAGVIRGCAGPRRRQRGTWITDEMVRAYTDLHDLGYAHSIEVWEGDELVGGLYGIAAGGGFAGESMFSRSRDASKHALMALVGLLHEWGIPMLDCQSPTRYLTAFGARTIPRGDFLTQIREWQERGQQVPRDWSSWSAREMIGIAIDLAARNDAASVVKSAAANELTEN